MHSTAEKDTLFTELQAYFCVVLEDSKFKSPRFQNSLENIFLLAWEICRGPDQRIDKDQLKRLAFHLLGIFYLDFISE